MLRPPYRDRGKRVGICAVACTALFPYGFSFEHALEDRSNEQEKKDQVNDSPATSIGSEEPVTVVIPAHNEEKTIAHVVEGVRCHVPWARILVVDDGSTDATAHMARSAGAEVISHPLQKGNGAAVKTALRAVSHGRIAIVDADGQHDPRELPELLKSLDQYDLVVGARNFTADILIMPATRKS